MSLPQPVSEFENNDVPIEYFVPRERQREDYGDLKPLMYSIKEFGLIQPIIAFWDAGRFNIVAGGRRLESVKALGWKTLRYQRDFLLREEFFNDEEEKAENVLRRKSMELEENLKRKDMTWAEICKAKAELHKIMQSIYGVAKSGKAADAYGKGEEAQTDTDKGAWSIRKMATLLGEGIGPVSEDIRMAEMLNYIPSLEKKESRTSALRKLKTIQTVVQMKEAAAAAAPAEEKRYILYEGDVIENLQKHIPDSSFDLIYSDLPYGVNLGNSSKHNKGVISYEDTRESIVGMLPILAREAYRTLRSDRFAVFFFGFNYYTELIDALEEAGFAVRKVPFIWYKKTRTTENPSTHYGNSYDPAIVAAKGSASFIRPGMVNFLDAPAITPNQKLQIAQQPVSVPSRFIEDMTIEDAMIADFTAGSGTTGEAALRLKRRVTLFEHDGIACDLIRARLGALKL